MKFKVLLKKWWVWVIVILVLLVGGYFIFQKDEPLEIISEVVERGVLTQTVDASGEVEAIDKVDLSFEISGTLLAAYAKVGESVEPGDLLMSLVTDELIADLQSSYQAVQVAEANLSQRKAGATSEAVYVLQAAVAISEANQNSAKVAYENAQNDLTQTESVNASSVLQARAALATARDNVSNASAANVDDLRQAYQDMVTTLRTAMIEVRSALSDADEIIGIRNTLANDDFDDVLGALDSQTLTYATKTFYQAERSRDAAEDSTFALTSSSSYSEIDSVYSLVSTALTDTATVLLHTRRVLDATNLNTAAFSSADLSTKKGIVDSARDAIQVEQTALINANQNIDETRIDNASNLDTKQNAFLEASEALEKALATEASQIAQKTAVLNSANATLALRDADVIHSKAMLTEGEASPRAVDLASLQAELQRTRASYASTEARLAKAEIRAPIAGVVTSIGVDAGEQVTAVSPVVTVQTTEEQFQILADIPEADIAKIKLNHNAEITLDAFGRDTTLLAAVVHIDPAEKVIEGVVFYEVTLLIDEVFSDLLLKPGMTADIEIHTVEKDNVISVSQRAVLRKNGDTYVRLLINEKIEDRFVKTGIRGDGGQIEILEGVSEGDVVVLSVR